MKTLTEQIEALVTPAIEAMGFVVVQVKLMDSHKSRLLQIMAERPDGSMNVDDCAAISRQMSALLDVEDIIPGEYRLEISSPGIDRPLKKAEDFHKFAGHLAKVETVLPIKGRRRFTGAIKSVSDATSDTGSVLTLTVDNADVEIPLADIHAAKLVLTDALIKEHMKKAM